MGPWLVAETRKICYKRTGSLILIKAKSAFRPCPWKMWRVFKSLLTVLVIVTLSAGSAAASVAEQCCEDAHSEMSAAARHESVHMHRADGHHNQGPKGVQHSCPCCVSIGGLLLPNPVETPSVAEFATGSPALAGSIPLDGITIAPITAPPKLSV
jgi:hypothetical protein